MIERVFEGERSREQIKNKFRKEERKNKQFVDGLLANREGLTLKDFQERYGPIRGFMGKKGPNKNVHPLPLKNEEEIESSHKP